MGTPPSYAAEPAYHDFLRGDDAKPAQRQEAEALANNPAALRERIAKLEGERAVDAARIAAFEAELRSLAARLQTLEAGR